MDEKRGIGKNNDLLFRIPEDFKRMKALTTGHPIIMGRKTFESIGRPLPNRTNIIVTQNSSRIRRDKIQNCLIANSLEQAIEYAKKAPGSDEIFIFGGGQIFAEALPLVDKLYLTIVKGDFGADIFFPDYSEFKKIVFEQKGESGEYKYRFVNLEKNQK